MKTRQDKLHVASGKKGASAIHVENQKLENK